MATERTKRTHILLPRDLAREIDAIAGRRGRSAFLVETAREAVRRRKLLGFLDSDAGWKDAEHPELAQAAGNWVQLLRLVRRRVRWRLKRFDVEALLEDLPSAGLLRG